MKYSQGCARCPSMVATAIAPFRKQTKRSHRFGLVIATAIAPAMQPYRWGNKNNLSRKTSCSCPLDVKLDMDKINAKPNQTEPNPAKPN